MHAPDGSCRKPAGARVPVTGGTGGHRARAPRPTAGVAAARLQAYPAVGGGACPKGALEPPPWAGRDAAGTPRAASGGARSQDASLPCGRDGARRGRGRGAAAHTMATARPIPGLIERKQPKGGHGGAGTRAGSRYASERWTRGQGSARFRCPMAARATAEMGRAACLKPPPGLSLSKSPFFCA